MLLISISCYMFCMMIIVVSMGALGVLRKEGREEGDIVSSWTDDKYNMYLS